ncbi:MAG TPA: hypothetical protein VEI02_02080 [Planctomycetota bacterium]|nr:hypothetical protein [Planctomycetota bacterium]
MQRRPRAAPVLLLLVAAACGDSDPAAPGAPTAQDRLRDLGRSTKDLAQDAGETAKAALAEARAAAADGLQRTLDASKPRLEELRRKAATLSGDAKINAEGALEKLKAQYAEAERKVGEIRTSEGWQSLKDGASTAVKAVADGLEELARRIGG